MLQGLVLRLCNVFHISFKSTNDECIYITLISNRDDYNIIQ